MDKLTASIVEAGIEVTPYYWQQSNIVLGQRFEHDGVELVYRVDEGEIVIVLLRRLRPNHGLANPFACLFYLAEHACQQFPPQWLIRGNVDVLRGSSMNSDRLARFYLRCCGASHDKQQDWYSLRLADYRPLKQQK
jgi:type III secretion system regulator LcrR